MTFGFAIYSTCLLLAVSYCGMARFLNLEHRAKLIDYYGSLQETTFIEQVVEDESQMEGVPPGCSRIMNWHLHLETRELAYPRAWLIQKNLDVVIRNS